jgi:hypothetical protein
MALEKEKHPVSARGLHLLTMPSAFSSLSSPGRTGDSPFFNKTILLHPIMGSAWIFPFAEQKPESSDHRLHQCQ